VAADAEGRRRSRGRPAEAVRRGGKEIAGLKAELGDIMGANVHGKPGNQQAAAGSAN
jgi:hypothetical protein